eukprot:Opistho-1_new@33259
MADQQAQDVGLRGRLVERAQLGIGQRLDIGFDRHRIEPARLQAAEHGECRRFAQIVDVRLEGEAKAGDHRLAALALAQRVGCGGDLVDHPAGLGIIHLARAADQPRIGGIAGDDEPRVHRDAMPADADAGLEDVDARMAVGQCDHVPHVDPGLVADYRQFVREGDVDVAEAVLGQLAHLGRGGVGQQHLAAHEAAIEGTDLLGRFGGQAADDAVILDQLDHDPSGQHPLGAIGDMERRDIDARFGQRIGDLPGRSDRGRRFENDDRARLDMRRDRAGRGEDIVEIGLRHVSAVAEGRGHADHEDVRRGGVRRCREHARGNRLAHCGVEIGFDDMDAAFVDRRDHRGVLVAAEDAKAAIGEQCRSGQPDIAEADDADSLPMYSALI